MCAAASKTASNKRARSTFVLVNVQFGSDGDADKLVAHLTSPGVRPHPTPGTLTPVPSRAAACGAAPPFEREKLVAESA